jgi:hypothetical protein
MSFVDALIKAIEADIAKAEKELDSDELKGHKKDKFFADPVPVTTDSAANHDTPVSS